MKKLIFTCIFFLIISICYPQDFITSFSFGSTKKMVATSYLDSSTQNSYSLVGNNKKLKAIQFDSNFNIIDSITIDRPDAIYENSAGFTLKGSLLNAYWMSENNDVVVQQTIDFKARKDYSKTLKLNLASQKILQTFSTNDKLYILSVIENTSLLNIQVIDNEGNIKNNTFDLSNTIFYNSKQKAVNLYQVLKENIRPNESAFELPIVNLETPTSLALTSKKRKCYFENDKITITINSLNTMTQLIQIDLKKVSVDCKFLYTPATFLSDDGLNNNSLLLENKILQLSVSPENFNFSISDLEGNLIKEYTANANNEKLPFINSNFTTEVVETQFEKKPANTKQFIEKISNLSMGICSYKIKDNYYITIGSISKHVKKIDEDANGFLMQYGLLGAAIYVVFYNPAQINYDFSRDFYFVNTLLDFNFNVKDEKVLSTPIGLIKNFFNFNPNTSLPTIISNSKNNYFGYYNIKNKTYNYLRYDK